MHVRAACLTPFPRLYTLPKESQRTWKMTLQITWQEAPVYPALIKGPSVGVVDGHLLVAGGMAYPWREVEYGFGAPILDSEDEGQEGSPPIGEWYPLPPIPIGPGWTSGAAVAGGLAVVGGRRRAVGNRATADVWFLDVQAGAADWERLPDRPSTGDGGDYLSPTVISYTPPSAPTGIRMSMPPAIPTSTGWTCGARRDGRSSPVFPVSRAGCAVWAFAAANFTSSAAMISRLAVW